MQSSRETELPLSTVNVECLSFSPTARFKNHEPLRILNELSVMS